MKPQRHRLPAGTARGFAGGIIDRTSPLQFRLDGRVISGFAGDTVLSAVLASGIDTLGRHQGHAIGLTPRCEPAISYASALNEPKRALPMARTPAVDGAELATLGTSRSAGLTRLLRPGRTLGLPLDEPRSLDRPWRAMAGEAASGHDLIVVGGGVAGLSAALAAARAGLQVTLVESRPHLGGHSGLFGTQEGEDSPEQSMSRLSREVVASDAITVLTSAHAYAIRPGVVRVHHVTLVDGKAQSRVIDLEAPRIVLATGAVERLPIFAGNRLPGVIGALDAYELATCYGIWPGRSAVVASVSNPVYRLAMLANDAGIAIPRILDARPSPASRFIEFSRAYGIIQAPGTALTATSPGPRGSLTLHTDGDSELSAERLVVCGGWQPDLTLWHIAGGKSQWHKARHRMLAEGNLDGVVLAGSAAGYFTRRGCIASGAEAVNILLRRSRKPAADTLIDALYETPDAASPVAEPQDGAQAYLDGGNQLLARPLASSSAWKNLFRRSGQPWGMTALSESPQPLTISEVAAGVDLGLIPPDAAGIVAQERVALVPLTLPTPPAPQDGVAPEPSPDHVPAYLAGRFGPDALVVRLKPEQERRFEPGALIYKSSDMNQPLLAIGVVLRQSEETTFALVAKTAVRTNFPLSVQDHGRATIAHIVSEQKA